MKIIIKIGTAAVFDSEKKRIKEDILKNLAGDISKLVEEGNEIIVVTSGAVGCGRGIIHGNGELGLKQAQAAVGQIILMEKYSSVFSEYNLNIAQFLLNSKDLYEKNRIENLRETYKNLKGKAIPVVNENDVTSIEELEVGDNDTLASRLLFSMNFDILIILTEMGALIKNKIPLKKSDLFDVEDYDKMNLPSNGFGGVYTKLTYAKTIIINKKK